MQNQEAHLSEHELMGLLQEVLRGKSFWANFPKILPRRRSAILEERFQHLTGCSVCLSDIWESYLSLETLQETQKACLLPQIDLKLDSLKSSFRSYIQSGFLLPISSIPAVSVRSGNQQSADDSIKMNYLLAAPAYGSLPLNFQVESTVNGIKFSWALESQTSDRFILTLFSDGVLTESQNITETTHKTDFFIHYDDIQKKTEISFKITTKNEEASHEILKLYLYSANQ